VRARLPVLLTICVSLIVLAGAASPPLPGLSLSGKGECRFSLASETRESAAGTFSAFHCEGDYRVATEGNEVRASRFDFDGLRLTATGNVHWENAGEQMTIEGNAIEYDFGGRTVKVSGGVRLAAKGYTAESDVLTYAQDSGRLELAGGVHIARDSETLEAQSVQVFRDGRFVAETGVIMKREQVELKCRHLEQRGDTVALAGDVWVRAQVANSEIALTAEEGEFKRDAETFRLSAVSGVFPGGDLRANEMELYLTEKKMNAGGDVAGTLQGRRFSADRVDLSFEPVKVVLSGRVRIWIPREEFRRQPR
jgi:lipopolysaccharide export system protein LptA